MDCSATEDNARPVGVGWHTFCFTHLHWNTWWSPGGVQDPHHTAKHSAPPSPRTWNSSRIWSEVFQGEHLKDSIIMWWVLYTIMIKFLMTGTYSNRDTWHFTTIIYRQVRMTQASTGVASTQRHTRTCTQGHKCLFLCGNRSQLVQLLQWTSIML